MRKTKKLKQRRGVRLTINEERPFHLTDLGLRCRGWVSLVEPQGFRHNSGRIKLEITVNRWFPKPKRRKRG